MKKIALHNLGCKVNSYEIEVMQENLEKSGYKIVPFAPGADIYIINTCTVTNIADRKSRQMLHKAKKMNPEAVVVAVGCYVQTGTENVKQDECIDLAVGNNKKKDIVPILEEYLKEKELNRQDKTLHETTIPDINDGKQEYEEMTLTHAGEHTRAYIKIQDGCNQFCSYCIIPYARGRVRSRKEEDIIREVKGLVAAGYQEVVVTGIHLSSYGLDFISKESGDYLQGVDIRTQAYHKGYLLDILEKINEIEGLKRIRIGSLEPRIITEKFANRLKSLDKLCPHFHLSLQSGCDETLKRMNRHYSAAEFKEKVEILRNVFENPAITTDVIVGFPGETKDEFQTTYEFLEDICFYEMHVFKYSKRQGTVAAARQDQVDDKVKTERSNLLLDLEQKQSQAYRKAYLGKDVDALMEEEKEIRGKKYQVGYTETYVKVAVETNRDLSNKIVSGKAMKLLDDEYLLLELADK
ncbi:MAG: tRNA (N(6)-L-threonylcarbamoyladenosine(37)-C(2))-methylthiotransferase MtaB [Lachnospiraceae bacterium]|nr:tRNA (N(6)-L-threonylcarbamoyladenosine(37)-C(2))-methylthiotransferase MtaB [Lachnospiraceae bacterium]